MAKLVLFNKPYQVLSQFSDKEGRATLADYLDDPSIYPAGRLDYDSEGLMLLTDDGQLQHRIAHPSQKMDKHYWVLVEGIPEEGAYQALRDGVELKDGLTRRAQVTPIEEPQGLWPRDPEVRYRRDIPTRWLEIVISEGRNRQVRRMTAAVGHPTLRLIRHRIGSWALEGLQPGRFRNVEVNLPQSSRRPWGGRRHTRPKL